MCSPWPKLCYGTDQTSEARHAPQTPQISSACSAEYTAECCAERWARLCLAEGDSLVQDRFAFTTRGQDRPQCNVALSTWSHRPHRPHRPHFSMSSGSFPRPVHHRWGKRTSLADTNEPVFWQSAQLSQGSGSAQREFKTQHAWREGQGGKLSTVWILGISGFRALDGEVLVGLHRGDGGTCGREVSQRLS